MFKSIATLNYSSKSEFWLVANVDPMISAYYRSQIPKSMIANKPMWPAHMTVVRAGKEMPLNLEHWGKYEGEQVEFTYEHEVHISKVYYWLNAWCDRLVEIREELGLPPKSRWTLPPAGRHQCFHITIANTK